MDISQMILELSEYTSLSNPEQGTLTYCGESVSDFHPHMVSHKLFILSYTFTGCGRSEQIASLQRDQPNSSKIIFRNFIYRIITRLYPAGQGSAKRRYNVMRKATSGNVVGTSQSRLLICWSFPGR